MYAIHIEPSGSTYKATKEEFVSRTPLPLTDNAVGPDGALYFTIGGRGTQSELFRVTYTGPSRPRRSTPRIPVRRRSVRSATRSRQFHRKADDPSKAIKAALGYLDSKTASFATPRGSRSSTRT